MNFTEDDLATRLKRLRTTHNLSVKQVATELSVAISTYREWENGRSISGEPYINLANLFKVSVHYLLTGNLTQHENIYKHLHDLKVTLSKLESEINSLD